MCDSTNVFSMHPGRSEASLTDAMEALLRESTGMVVATTFASNVARLKTIALAAQAGARVIAVARKSSALNVARAMGAVETVRMDDHERVIGQVRELTGDEFCERVVEVTGAPWPLDLAGELTGVGGRLVIAGFHQDGLRSVDVQLWNWRGIDVVNAHERDPLVALRGIRDAVEAACSGRLDPRALYTHSYPLERLGDAMTAAQERPDGFVKALVLR